ncbi:MAG: type II toxin-antitoxin system RelE/ParE family toxin [Brevundimonas sp.]|uniref:type II toxin-antitoxin system RelE/ParE family toxin n=1 Tax=Brevundimonas sp. TaxID=1871086 RepID=UPI002732A9AF|nr:type II toxin-antitoxin system RelE/ParE family toxin [Brevundimonas sp.]MDP3403075.1 type II toxin-antitoxin system RelE/ParE family toxin [Brevundimonas sp.]
MKTVVWSSHARSQYLSALGFLVERNEAAAASLSDRIEATTAALARRSVGRPGYAEGTLEKTVSGTSYVLVFELSGDELRILRLFHMAQDWRGWRDTGADDQ